MCLCCANDRSVLGECISFPPGILDPEFQCDWSLQAANTISQQDEILCGFSTLSMYEKYIVFLGYLTKHSLADFSCSAIVRGKKPRFLVSDKCHPQTIAVCQSRADGLGLVVEVAAESDFVYGNDVCGCLVQYPATDGSIRDYGALVKDAHAAGVKVVVATGAL